MRRFYLPPAQCQGKTLTLQAREAHHGLHVLRLRRGDEAMVLDGAGHEFRCQVSEAGRSVIHLTILEQRFVPPSPTRITLLQAIPKGRLFEDIVEKATELGAFRIVPLLSERVTMHLGPADFANKVSKWRLASIEAIKQCGSTWLPQIDEPVSPEAFLKRREIFELALIASLEKGGRHPREWFKRFYAEHQRLAESIAVWVGPEGDFTAAEVDAAAAAGALPISLGPLVLRCETAAVCCLSIINYELQSKVA